ncbi:HECT-domain-containing protein [Anaeromyces robustus]|uniref:HECT-type E3 ubiquitin transferase n=1 Tax=Anaeromyces robustus TaxID=1754192 RepID=A0A1Y1VPI5_9FUNG|nr:HECT-domain-containing protein [Anaeromyces robustus]|eukprot:ORX62479.1 HECT-domain-containing protein [Anaeromyces robustus]
MSLLSRNKKTKSNNKEQKELVDKLGNDIDNEDLEILNEGIYEWKIKNWSQLTDKICSPEFNIGGFKWKLQINVHNKNNNNEHISLYLNNVDIQYDSLCYINTKYIFFIRNYYDYSCIQYGDSLSNCYSKNNYSFGNEKFIEKSKLFTKHEDLKKALVENDRCVVGVYIRTFKCRKEQYMENIKSCINDENHEILNEFFYEWKINNWDKLSNNEYSPEFYIENHKWKLKLCKNSFKPVISLENLDSLTDNTVHICSKFVFFVRNSDNYDYYHYYDSYSKSFNYFNKEKNSYKQNLESNLFLSKKGGLNKYLIENNSFVVGVFIRTYKYNEVQIKNELDYFIKYYGFYEILSEGFYEWNIEDWEQISNIKYSPEFIIDNHKWQLELRQNGIEDDNYISLYLNNLDVMDDPSCHICIKQVFYIRNYNDCSYFYYQGKKGESSKSILYYNQKNNSHGYHQFIKKSELFSKNENSNKSLVENNKCVIGVYFRESNYMKDQFKDELKSLLDNENLKVESEGLYEWNIENWQNLNEKELNRSFNFKNFIFGRHKWMLQLYPDGHGDINKDYVSLYLKNIDDENINFSHICTKAILYIRNYNNNSCYIFKELPITYYNETYNISGFDQFIEKSKLFISNNENSNKSALIENDKCVIGSFIRTYEYKEVKKEFKEFKSKLANKINNENHQVLEEILHEFKIENWDPFTNDEYNSTFIIGNYKWKLEIHSNGNDEDEENSDYVKVILKNLDVENNDSINICAKSVIFIKHSCDYSCFTSLNNESFIYYNKNNNSISFNISKSKLFTKMKEFMYKSIIEYNKCIAGVFLRIYEYKEAKEKKEIEKKQKDVENIENLLKSSSLVIAISNFTAYEYDQLDIRKDEFLIVTDWNYKDGWVYGYRKDNKKEKGIFPKIFVKICNENRKEENILRNEIITPEYRISFENKVKQFRSQNDMKMINNSETRIIINRNNLFNDAFTKIMNKSPEELKKLLRIKYKDEEGIDAGGLLRDFFNQISKEIGNPDYSLLQYSNDNSYELEINPKSNIVVPDHLKYFKFIGRIMGLAIFHKQYLSLTFTLLFYKKILNKPLEFPDLKYVDLEIYKNINWLRENEGAGNLSLTFSIENEDCYGNRKKIELKPNGANIDVNDLNKEEYIKLVVENKLNDRNDEEQLNSIKEGFYEIIPKNINSIFDELDLKYLISGINEIDVDDWEENTDYEGYNKNDITIINFWKCVREFSNDKRKSLLLFATGNSQVPVTGFKDLQGNGNIQHFRLKKYGAEDDLPISHTCFNRIDLPPYTTYTQLKQKLLRAITEGVKSFEME